MLKKMLTVMMVCAACPAYAYSLNVSTEAAQIYVIGHDIQFGKNGTDFDLRNDGGQDTLFPTWRLKVDMQVSEKSKVDIQYQPIQLETSVLLSSATVADNETFPANTPLNILYSFPILRFGYSYFLESIDSGWSVGAAAQIRNARIDLSSGDGSKIRSNRDIGFVPLFRVGYQSKWNDYWFLGHVDTIYAPVKYLNGGKSDVTGTFTDASLSLGKKISDPYKMYFTIRYIGGGAEGTSSDDSGPGDGFSSNWIHLAQLSLALSRTF